MISSFPVVAGYSIFKGLEWPVLFTFLNRARHDHSGPKWTQESWQWRGAQHSQKLPHYWNLTIRLFSVISRTLVGYGSYPSAEVRVGIFYSLSWLGNFDRAKEMLITEPELYVLDFNKSFELVVDASDIGIRAIMLLQRDNQERLHPVR